MTPVFVTTINRTFLYFTTPDFWGFWDCRT